MDTAQVAIVLALLLAVANVAIIAPYAILWIRARQAGFPLRFRRILALRMQGLPLKRVIGAYLAARRGGIDLELDLLVAHHLSGGEIEAVVDALLRLRQDGRDTTFDALAAKQLAGQDLERQSLDDLSRPVGAPQTEAS